VLTPLSRVAPFVFQFCYLSSENSSFRDHAYNSHIAQTVGYLNQDEQSKAYNEATFTLGLNAALNLISIIKFSNKLFPHLALVSNVVAYASIDLFLFSIVFLVCLTGFASLFFLNLHAQMWSYKTYYYSFITMLRGLSGDFDMDTLDGLSSDGWEAMLFLFTLFVLVFILLTMFLTILGNAASTVLGASEEEEEKEREMIENMQFFKSGATPLDPIIRSFARCCGVGDTTSLDDDAEKEEEEARRHAAAEANAEKAAIGAPQLTPQRKSEKSAAFLLRKAHHDSEREDYFAHLRGALALLQSGTQLLAEVREEYKQELDAETENDQELEEIEEEGLGGSLWSGLDQAMEYLE
jgi:hypothetical protein